MEIIRWDIVHAVRGSRRHVPHPSLRICARPVILDVWCWS